MPTVPPRKPARRSKNCECSFLKCLVKRGHVLCPLFVHKMNGFQIKSFERNVSNSHEISVYYLTK